MGENDERSRRRSRLIWVWLVGAMVAAAFMTLLIAGVAHLTGGAISIGLVPFAIMNLILWVFAGFFIVIRPYW
jgi:hypothetical protein